jgi:lipopolysaccharide export system protein LptC
MIGRVVLAVLMLGILGALLYFKDPDNGAADAAAGADAPAEPGFAALHAVLIETGEDGEALYRLTAERMEQPQPQGTIFLTAPQLEYQPEVGNQWRVHALRGQLPQDARTAELDGMVHGEGKPAGSDALMRFDTEDVHLDMRTNLATSAGDVHVDWDGNQLLGRGMTADLNRYTLQLQSDVRGTFTH